MLEQATIRQDLETEILSNIFQDNDLMNGCLLDSEHFYYSKHRAIFKTMQGLSKEGQPIDVTNVALFDEENMEAVGGFSYLNDIAGKSPSTASFDYHQKNLIGKATISKLNSELTRFIELSASEADLSSAYQLQTRLEQILEGATQQEKEETTNELFMRRFEEYQIKRDGLSGVDTGFERLNKTTDGWVLGDLIIVGARPSIGKTALSGEMMVKGIKNDEEAYGTFLSCEMPKEQIIDRIYASNSNINLFKLRNAEKSLSNNEWGILGNTVGELSEIGERFQVLECRHLEEIRKIIRRTVRINPSKKHVFYIDHLDHIRIDGKFQSKHHEVSEIVHELKHMARKEKVAIVLLCQLSRSVESRPDKHPMMSDLRESGTIEQVADVIVLLYRDDYYNKQNSKLPGVMELIIGKNRNGATTTLPLGFRKETSSFYDLDDTRLRFVIDAMKEANN